MNKKTGDSVRQKFGLGSLARKLQNKLVSFVFIPMILVNSVGNPFKQGAPSVSASDKMRLEVTASALDSYMQLTHAVSYHEGENKVLDSLAKQTHVSPEEIKETVDETLGKPLTQDALFAKQDSVRKHDLFIKGYPAYREFVMPDTVSPSYLNIKLFPVLGTDWLHNHRSSKAGYRQLPTESQPRLHAGFDDQLYDDNGHKVNQIGLPVHAMEGGVIVSTGITTKGNTGQIVIRAAEDANGYVREYAYDHINTLGEVAKKNKKWKNKIPVFHVGDTVEAGDVFTKIAKRRPGESMYSKNKSDFGEHGEHVHVEIRVNKKLRFEGNNLFQQDGFLGTVKQSKGAKKIGSYFAKVIQNDPTGEKFWEMSNKMADQAGAKVTAEWVYNAAMEKTREREGGKNYDTHTNNGLTKDGIADLPQFRHRNVMSLTKKEVGVVYEYIAKQSGIDSLLKPVADPVEQARRFAMVPQQLDAMVNHNPDNAVKMIRAAHGDHHQLELNRINHVRQSHKIPSKYKADLYDRYKDVDGLSDQIETAMLKNNGIIVNPEYNELIGKYNDVKNDVAKKEFIKDEQLLARQVAEDMQELNTVYAMDNNDAEPMKNRAVKPLEFNREAIPQYLPSRETIACVNQEDIIKAIRPRYTATATNGMRYQYNMAA